MKNFVFVLVAVASTVLFIPSGVSAAGLGEAGSITFEGLVIGLAVLGVIFLVFMGLLLLARVRELSSLANEPGSDEDMPAIHFTPEDIMSLNVTEINQLLRDRNGKVRTKGKTAGFSS